MTEGLKGWINHLGNRRVSPQGLKHMRDSLMDDSDLDRDYIVLTIGACIIATLGLLSNSAAVIIGAMLVAPLMLPIRGMAFGILEGDLDLLKTGVRSLLVGTGLSVGLATALGLLLGFSDYGSEVWARSEPTLLDLGIAIAAGGISGYAKVQPKISSTLAGTAIAVALMPPVCVIGLGIAQIELTTLSWGATLLYLTNLVGITLSCMLAFLLTGYAPIKQARRPLSLVSVMTGVLIVPLGLSLINLVQQNRLEAGVQDALVNGTVTFQRLRTFRTETNWLTHPPQVRLVVASVEPLTPRQVMLLEDYLEQRMNRRFELIFEVGQIQEVTSSGVQPIGEFRMDGLVEPAELLDTGSHSPK
ncbi:MAG: DUF389 domain-containing protein [Cyanobacteria bacterium P01_D01_bin.14]